MKLNEKNIRKISILVIVFGILSLIYIDSIHELPLTNLNEISVEDLNKNVKVKASVKEQVLLNKNLFFTIYNNDTELNGVLFNQGYKINPELEYYIKGRVSMYEKELQIIVNEVNNIKY